MPDFRAHQLNHFDLPARINRLGELAYNLWWTWMPNAQDLFERIEPTLWQEVGHNPVLFLRNVDKKLLQAAAEYLDYVDLYDRIMSAFDVYLRAEDTWFKRNHPEFGKGPIAYFSTEFGLHETLPIYAGGLGILAGDHLKEASDLGLPLVAMGFLYTQGYFSQHISEDGWQESRRMRLEFGDLPVMPILDEDGQPITVSVELAGRTLHARIWEIHIGRVALYLLDSNVDENNSVDRALTERLYSSDPDLRISQEILLGIGGVRALRMMGYNPVVWHMNEGHSAFLALERAREQVANGLTFDEAKEKLRPHNLFTTHTPVPAGSDEFPRWLIDKYFSNFWPELGLDAETFMGLARREQPWGESFSMPILALRFSGQANGVSELHGRVARKMWNFLWPEIKEEDVKISYVTNGVHTGTWLARRMGSLYMKHIAKDWKERLDDPQLWDKALDIPDEELWKVRRHQKRRMVAYIREHTRRQWMREGIHPVQVIASGVLLDPYVLTIGFARRFATYKRANLILRDMDRLLALLSRRNEPVQIIFAGKAHPADEPGKQLIQQVYRAVKRAENGGRLVFLEDYDIHLARYLVQGVDVWLNTPRRPFEASGTSGQKAALNGGLNLSILDGWWREGYNGKNGWVIGEDKDVENPDSQDEADASLLYELLENVVIPLYYEDHIPGQPSARWFSMVKESIRSLAPRFSARRMLKEYIEKLYIPAVQMADLQNVKQ